MTTALKTYPAMKDSGVAWLGEVPEHWEVRRAKFLFREIDHRSKTGTEPLLSLRMVRGLVPHNEVSTIPIDSKALIGFKKVEPRQIVMNRMRAAIGLFGVAEQSGLVSPDYAVFDSLAKADVNFFLRLFKNPIVGTVFRIESKGLGTGSSGFMRLYTDRFGMIKLPLPPLPEQHAIVRYLDHMDRRIRRFIRAKQKLIALLTEQKQAIVHRAVTRGLDADVKLKESGVEWLGEVPEGWEVLRTRYLFREVDNRSKDGTEVHLSMSQKLGLVPSSLVDQRTLVSESYAGGKLCEKDDLVLNRLKAHLGVFALAQQSGVISPDYTVLRKIRPMAEPYFEHVLRSQACRTELRIRAKGIVAGFWRLYTDDFYDIKLPVPPESEQEEIVRHLGIMTESIQSAIQKAEHEITLLQEYRTRLIADVVTGKADVREVAAGLPEEIEEEVMESGEEEEDVDVDLDSVFEE